MSRESAYALRRRADARGFAQAWDAARLLAVDHLADLAWDRAVNGTARPVWYHGELVGEVVHHDSRLLLGLIAQNRKLAAALRGGGGAAEGQLSPLASGAVVGAVLDDWEAALDRVERGEALAEGASGVVGADGTVRLAENPLHHRSDGPPPRAGEELIPPPLPVEFEREGPSRGQPLNEAQALEVGAYEHWWDEDHQCWLTNWPAPPEWEGRRYVINWLNEVVPIEPGAEEPDGETVRTLSAAEEAGLGLLAQAGVAARAARLDLYRQAYFGLASTAQQASLSAANGGRSPWGRGAAGG